MSPVRKNVFVYMIMFLRELLKKSEQNELTADFLGMVFSRAFIVNASEQQLTKEYRVAQETVTEVLIYLLKASSQQLSGEAVEEESESGASDEE